MPAKSRSNCADLGRRGTNHIMDTWIFIWYLFLPLLKNTRIFAVLAEKCRSWKKNAVVRNCQSTWSGIFAVWSGTFAVWSGIFAAEKRVWHQYIRRNSGLPKKVVFMQNLFIEQKAEIKPLLKRQVYIYILCVCGYVCVYVCLYIYIQYIIKPHFQTCPCEIWVLWFACCERTFLWRLSTAALDTGRHTGVCLNRTDADVSGRKCLAGDVARPSIAIRSWIWKPLKIAPGNNLQIWKW